MNERLGGFILLLLTGVFLWIYDTGRWPYLLKIVQQNENNLPWTAAKLPIVPTGGQTVGSNITGLPTIGGGIGGGSTTPTGTTGTPGIIPGGTPAASGDGYTYDA